MLKRHLHVSLSSFQHECKRATVCQLPVSNVFHFPQLCAVADYISFVCVLLWVTFWIHYQILSSPTCGRLLWTLLAKNGEGRGRGRGVLSNMIKCIACSLCLSSKFSQSHSPVLDFQLNMQKKYILHVIPVQMPLCRQYGGNIALSFIQLLLAIEDGMSNV